MLSVALHLSEGKFAAGKVAIAERAFEILIGGTVTRVSRMADSRFEFRTGVSDWDVRYKFGLGPVPRGGMLIYLVPPTL